MKGIRARVENGAKQGLILAGDLVAQRAARKAPVDKGRLKRSIARGNPVRVGDGMAISVGSNVEYAMAQELGVGANAEDPSKSKVPEREGNKPHPYLRPALAESKKEATRLIASRILAAILRP